MWPFHKKAETSPAQGPKPPHFVICGFGTHDRLQLSVETQRTLSAYGKCYAIGLAPAVQSLLRGLRVQVIDLDGSFGPGRAYGDVYIEVVATLLRQATSERPVVLLVPGNPLFLDAVARTLVMEARRLDLSVQVLPAVSLVDVLVNEIGLDISLYGLQVFEAPWLLARAFPLSTGVPLLILNIDGIGREEVPSAVGGGGNDRIAPLVEHLLRFYPPPTSVLCLRLQPQSYGLAIERRALASLADGGDDLVDCHLFIDAIAQEA